MKTILKEQYELIALSLLLTVILFLASPSITSAHSLGLSPIKTEQAKTIQVNPHSLIECLSLSAKTVAKDTVYHTSPPGGAIRYSVVVTVNDNCGSAIKNAGITITVTETCTNGKPTPIGSYSAEVYGGYSDSITATQTVYCVVIQNGKVIGAVVPASVLLAIDSNGLLNDNDVGYAPTTYHLV